MAEQLQLVSAARRSACAAVVPVILQKLQEQGAHVFGELLEVESICEVCEVPDILVKSTVTWIRSDMAQ